MALSSFNVQVDLGIGGITTGVSPEKVVKGGLQQLHNGDISVPGRIRKRRGRSVNIDHGTPITAYERTHQLFSSAKSCYRIVDGITTSVYDGAWFASTTSITSRSKIGHKILQRLVSVSANQDNLLWSDVGAYPTPIVEQVIPWSSGRNIENANSSALVNEASVEGREFVRHVCTTKVTSSNGFREYTLVASVVSRSSVRTAGEVTYTVHVYNSKTNELVVTYPNFYSASTYSLEPMISATSSGRYALFRFSTGEFASGHGTLGFDADGVAFSARGEMQAVHAPATTNQNAMQCAATKTHFVIQGQNQVHLYTFASIMAGGVLTPAVSVSTAANGQVVQGYQEYGAGTNFGAIWWSNTAPWTLVGRIWDSTGVAITGVTTIATLSGGATPYSVTPFAKPIDIPHNTAAGIANSSGQSMVFVHLAQGTRRGTSAFVFGHNTTSGAFTFGTSSSQIHIEGLIPAAQPFSMMGSPSTTTGLLGDIDNNYLAMISMPTNATSSIGSCVLMQFGVRYITSGGSAGWQIYTRAAAKLAEGLYDYASSPSASSASCAQLLDAEETVVVPIMYAAPSDCRLFKISNNSINLGVVVPDGALEMGNGGFPCSIGDDFVHEREPLCAPSIVDVVPDNSGVGDFLIGSYLIAVVSRIAYPGQLFARSAPALFSVNVATRSTILTIQVHNPNRCTNAAMGLNDLFGSLPIITEVYCSQQNATIPYLDNDSRSPSSNYSIASPGISSNPILYVIGGEIENISPSSCKSISTYRNRRVAACGDSEPTLWIGKEQSNQSVGQFTDVFRQPLPFPAWKLTAVEELDDKLILFTDDSIWYISGDGPNDTGTQGGFSPATRIAEGVGCINARALVRLDNTIMFRAREGFYYLNSNLSVQKVSATADWFSQLEKFKVLAAVRFDSRKQVSFFCEQIPNARGTGWILTYYPETQQWSADNAGITVGAAYGDRMVVRRDADGTNIKISCAMEPVGQAADDFVFNDYAGTQYSLIAKTGWIDFAGLQNLNRVWRCIILGRAWSECTLNVGFAFDYNPKIVHTQQIPITLFTVGGTSVISYRDWSAYEDPFAVISATNNPQAQWRITMPRQKIQSVQLTIWDSNQAPSASVGPQSGESFELNQITFECGLRQAVMKLGAGQSY